MQTSQEHFTTIVYAKFGGANRVHYRELENRELKKIKYWQRNGGFTFQLEVKNACLMNIFCVFSRINFFT